MTLVDDRVATDEALFSSNFLIPPDENVYRGKTLAELCCDSLKDFNPMVRVSVEKGLPHMFCIFLSCSVEFADVIFMSAIYLPKLAMLHYLSC